MFGVKSQRSTSEAGLEPGPDSWLALFDGRYRAALLTVSLGIGLFSFNEFLVSTAMPSAVADVSGASLLSWAVTVYLVPSILGGSCAAWFKHRLTARLSLFAAGLVFLAGTLIAASAPSMAIILLGRALQGAGDGVIAALCYALIPALFPSQLIARVFGVEALVWAISASAGPVVSGWFTQHFSWRAAFLVNTPIILGFLTLVPLVTPADPNQRETAEPTQGSGIPVVRLLAIGIGIMLVAIAAIASAIPARMLCLIGAGCLLAWAVRRDQASAQHLFPRGVFRLSSRIGSLYWVILLMPAAHAVSSVYLVLGLQQLWQLRPAQAGAIAAVMALSWSASTLLIAGCPSLRVHLARSGPWLLFTGLLCLLAALASKQLVLVGLGQVITGSGFGVCWATLSQTVMEGVEPADRDRATALLPTMQSAGYAIGAAVAGLAANMAGLPEQLRLHAVTVPLEWAYATAAVISAAAVAASVRAR